jgi:hypothetical protein
MRSNTVLAQRIEHRVWTRSMDLVGKIASDMYRPATASHISPIVWTKIEGAMSKVNVREVQEAAESKLYGL